MIWVRAIEHMPGGRQQVFGRQSCSKSLVTFQGSILDLNLILTLSEPILYIFVL